MTSEKFRRQLRQEAELWRSEGLINPELYEQLGNRYQWQNLEASAHDRFLITLMLVGSILVGLGVITFVAANWQVWSRDAKVALLLTLFIGVNATGFYLWRSEARPQRSSQAQVSGWKHRLGLGLLLLGGLILGANMALMSQMFHLDGSTYELFVVWGLGVLAMAYSLRLRSLGVLSILLVGIGYLMGWLDWSSVPWENQDAISLLLRHMPLAVVLLFFPLAYWCASRVLFGLAAILFVFAWEYHTVWIGSTLNWPVAWSLMLVIALPATLLWNYDDLFIPVINTRFFRPLSRSLAIVFLSGVFYLASFHWWWTDVPTMTASTTVPGSAWFSAIDILVFLVLAMVAWGYPKLQRRRSIWRNTSADFEVVNGFILVASAIVFWHLSAGPLTLLATFGFNVLLFLLAAGLMRIGLEQGRRRDFWFGLVLLTLQIFSRTLEYDTELLLKSLVFVLCGIGVLVSGFWFERHLSQSGAASRLPTSKQETP